MGVPTDRRYAESHEWHRLDDGVVVIGLTQHAVDELTDVTFVELPDVGTSLSAGDSFGEIESVKATSDLYTGVGGTVKEINQAVVDDPSVVNSDPYGQGWLIKLEPNDTSELENLFDAAAYDQKHGGS